MIIQPLLFPFDEFDFCQFQLAFSKKDEDDEEEDDD